MRDDRQRRGWPRHGRAWAVAVVVLVLVLVGWAGMTASALAAESPPLQARFDATVEQLIAEANQLDQFEGASVEPLFARPHPSMRDWGAEMGPVVLNHLGDSFTGDEYRDAYIRWHLMPPIRQMLEEAYLAFRESGEHRLPTETLENLRTAAADFPPPLQRPYREEFTWEPEDLGREYRQLVRQSRVTVGIPPFEEYVYGREALQRTSGAQHDRLVPIVERLEALQGQVTRVQDPEAIAFNERLRRINAIMRDFRGDLVYALIQSGEGELLRAVVEEITREVTAEQYTGIDLLEYMYYAMLDGYLALYDAEELRRASRSLERMARQADVFKVYLFGEEPPPGFMARRERNAGDLAFHLIHVFQNAEVLALFEREASQPPRQEPFRPADFQFTSENFTERDVRVAMDRALVALHRAEGRDLQPAYMLSEEARLARRYARNNNTQRPIINEIGNHAVAAWAMLAAGESFQQPGLFKRINWVLSGDPPFTYDRGMRLQLLTHLPGRTFQPWVHRDRTMLERGLTDMGNWSHHTGMGEATGWGDHANGAYGVLGLWGADLAGADIEPAQWRLIDAHWRKTQQQTEADQPAGWALGMFNVEMDDAERQRLQNIAGHDLVTGPMTAAGVMTLSLTEHELSNTQHDPTPEGSMSLELQKGLRWLDANFRLDDTTADDWFYYMWTIQRVGQISGRRRFGEVDWFRDVTAEMLNRQGANGLWNDPAGRLGPLMSSSFALLYLSTINTPVAIGKLRFDGAWNNRPHDIWNFADYASDWYEHVTSWQIIEPSAPVHHLIESPILYLSSNGSFTVSDAGVERLRAYLEAGGMLLVNQEGGGGAEFNLSLSQLRERLLPGREFEPLNPDHPLMTINKHLTGNTSVQAISNDIRPLVLYFNRDLGEDLQENKPEQSDSFALLSNTYLYTVGLNPRRSRLEQAYLHRDAAGQPGRTLEAARLRHDGQFDPEPGALTQLQTLLANEHNVDLQYETLAPSQLSGQRLAFLTTTGEIQMSDDEVRALRSWLENGGTLWLDAAGGAREAADGVEAFVRRLLPGQAGTRLTSRDPIVSGVGLEGGHNNRRVTYRPYLLIRAGGSTTPRLHQIRIDDRPAVIVSSEDLTAGLAGLGHWGIYGYSVESARKLVVNGVLDVLQDE